MLNKMKQTAKILLSGMLAFTFVIQSVQVTAKAADTDNVKVNVNGDTVTIGNEYITREFSVRDNKLSTTSIVNKRTEKETIFNPASGSEEFIIKTTKEAQAPISLPAIDRTGWTAISDSYAASSGVEGPASNMLDGNIDTIWHTNYQNQGTGPDNYPYNVVFTLNRNVEFQSFSYTPRKQGCQ